MKFPYLSELGSHYRWEKGTSGVRQPALTGLEAKLKRAIVDLNNLVTQARTPSVPAPTTVSTGNLVKDRIRQHELLQKQANPNSAIATARAEVDRIKKWLTLQGVQIKSDGSIDWAQDSHVVEYDDDTLAQSHTRLRFAGGRIFTDDLCTKALDTSGMVTHFSGPGHAIFVMGKTGNLHVDSHAVGYRHHSSLLAGKKVAGAGELKVVNGFLHWLSNKSGHYAPSIDHLMQVLHILQKKNVAMTFRVSAFFPPPGPRRNFANVADFMKAMELDGVADYELNKLFAYWDHLTDSVLGPKGWRWRIPADGEEAGVHEINTKQLVPHKVVRQWLKSQGLFAKKTVQSGFGR
jgi:hypothetical protein